MNEILFILGMLLAFSGIILVGRFFGKEGLISWVALASVLANIFVTKQVIICGFNTTLGNIMFSSIYLCTDIISEVYGMSVSKKAVKIGVCSAIIFVLASQLVLCFQPSDIDTVHSSMQQIFNFTLRTTVASVVMFFVSNMADVYLFEFLKKKFPDALWFRNNVATIVCNCAENFFFVYGAFFGIYSFNECLEIALTTCVIEIIISLCDTPFVYLGKKVVKA